MKNKEKWELDNNKSTQEVKRQEWRVVERMKKGKKVREYGLKMEKWELKNSEL